LENSDDASSWLKTNYKVFEKKRLKIFVRGFRGASPLNILEKVRWEHPNFPSKKRWQAIPLYERGMNTPTLSLPPRRGRMKVGGTEKTMPRT